MGQILSSIGKRLTAYLSKERPGTAWVATSRPDLVKASLRKGDVLLVEGTSRFSAAVKYLTQSSWSHAALFVEDSLDRHTDEGEPHVLIEANLEEGVRSVPLSHYKDSHTRICRPVGLAPEQIDQVAQFAIARLGQQYDLRNIIDLARYLIQAPPVPRRWRRRLMALGSGDPTQAICSSLIAQAFQSINYPILPEVELQKAGDSPHAGWEEILFIRHHSLFTPRDFDVSPFFSVVKPRISHGFDPSTLKWACDVSARPNFS